MMSFMIPPWAKWAALAVMMAGMYLFGRGDGKAIKAAELAEYKLQLSEAAAKLQAAHAAVVTVTEIEYRDRIKVIKEKGATIVEQVPIYITADTDRGYPLPAGFVRVHNAAAAGEVAGPAAESDSQAAAITASAAAATIAGNYAECRGLAEQVTGWQQFYHNLQVTTASYSP